MVRITLATLAALCLLACFILPTPSTAQREHLPTNFLHGWLPVSFAASRNPATPHLYYIVDSVSRVLAIDGRDGRIVSNSSYFFDPFLYLGDIAVDSRGYVYVAAQIGENQLYIAVLDESLRSVKNVSLRSLQPPVLDVQYLQLVVDSTNALYLFNSGSDSSTDGQVWRLSPRQWLQSASWKAPIQLRNNITTTSSYVMAIDSDDYLYFQQINGYKMLYITSQKGQLQYTYQLGTGNMSDPWIEDVAIDAQMRMWHTHIDDTVVSVVDSDGQLVAEYDILSTNLYGYPQPIDVDQYNNVVVADGIEEALLIVSPQGDITNSLASRIPSFWTANDLLADYGGGGRGRANGSLLFGDWASPYIAKRISVDDRDTGTLLQRYSLPDRLAECYDAGLDIGGVSSNIYVLLRCYDPTLSSLFYTLVYVMAQSGRVISEFHVSQQAYFIRADERTGVIYVAAQGSDGDAIIAYSSIDGRQLVSYTTTNPFLDTIFDITILPPTPQTGATLLVVDTFNRRFVHIDPSGNNATVSQPFANNTRCYRTAFTRQSNNGAIFYVSCTRSDRVNGTYIQQSFVHRWDVTDPNYPILTDTYLPPAGVRAFFAPIVVGLDQHLYVLDYQTSGVWQFRDADRRSAVNGEQPRIHIGRPLMQPAESVPGSLRPVASVEQHSALSRQRRIRGVTPS